MFKTINLLTLIIFSIINLNAFAIQKKIQFVTPGFPPCVFTENNKVSGPIYEIAQIICKNLNKDCDFKVYPFRRAIQNIENEEADVIFPVVELKERKTIMDFSEPFLKTTYAFYGENHKDFKINKLKDLSGFTLAAYGPSATSNSLKELVKGIANTKLQTEAIFEDPFKMLAAGRYGDKALVYSNKQFTDYWLKNQNQVQLKEFFDGEDIKYRFGFRKKNADLKFTKKFKAELEELKKSTKVKEMFMKYGISENDVILN